MDTPGHNPMPKELAPITAAVCDELYTAFQRQVVDDPSFPANGIITAIPAKLSCHIDSGSIWHGLPIGRANEPPASKRRFNLTVFTWDKQLPRTLPDRTALDPRYQPVGLRYPATPPHCPEVTQSGSLILPHGNFGLGLSRYGKRYVWPVTGGARELYRLTGTARMRDLWAAIGRAAAASEPDYQYAYARYALRSFQPAGLLPAGTEESASSHTLYDRQADRTSRWLEYKFAGRVVFRAAWAGQDGATAAPQIYYEDRTRDVTPASTLTDDHIARIRRVGLSLAGHFPRMLPTVRAT